MLLSLPDNDTHSHRNGPYAQVSSLAEADRALERMMHAAGGPDAFLADHAVVVCSDHSQSKVEAEIDLFSAFDGFEVLPPDGSLRRDPEVALCPASRSAQVYLLEDERRDELAERVERTALALEGVDLVIRMSDHPDGEAIVRSSEGELRFRPGGDLEDLRGGRWSVDGDRAVLELAAEDGRVSSRSYPDALARVWSALRCRTSGEVLLSAAPGYEFRDWGGGHHVGGGSHGSLHATDSHAALIWCGTGPAVDAKPQWSLRDVTPMVLDHFGVAA
jgi:hypothetical protein